MNMRSQIRRLRWIAVGVVVGVMVGISCAVACVENPLAHPWCCVLLPRPGTPDVDAGPRIDDAGPRIDDGVDGT